MNENIIEVEDVYKTYGEVKALAGVSLSVPMNSEPPLSKKS
jgi:ABC-type sugar transport system ATPase subunit